MSAVMDRFNQGQANGEIVAEQGKTNKNMEEFIKLATQFNETMKSLYHIEVAKGNSDNTSLDTIAKISNSLDTFIDDNQRAADRTAKLANPKELAKGNKKDGLIKGGFIKLMTLGVKKLIKKMDAPAGIFQKQAETKQVAAQPAAVGAQQKPGKPTVDSEAAGQMGAAIGGILAKNLTPGNIMKSFFKVLLPKIIIAIFILTLFIKAWFNTDVYTAFAAAVFIVTNAFMLYIAWQIAKTMFTIAFEIACTSMVTGAKLAAVATEMAMSFMVYAGFLIIIPLILLCFVLLTAIVAVVVIAILLSVVKIVEVVGDVMIRAVEAFFNFLGMLFGGGNKEEEKGDTVNASEEVNKALLEFTNAAIMAVQLMSNMTSTVQLSAIAILTELGVGMAALCAAALAWVVNPFMMMMLAVAAGASYVASLLGGNKDTNVTEDNAFSTAIEPLISEVKVIGEILSSIAACVGAVSQTTIKTVNNTTSANSSSINSSNTAVANDSIAETKYTSAKPTTNEDVHTTSFDDTSMLAALNKQNAILNELLNLAKRKGLFG